MRKWWGTRLDIVDRWGASLAGAVLLLLLLPLLLLLLPLLLLLLPLLLLLLQLLLLLLLFLLLLLLIGACHLSDTVPSMPVANLHTCRHNDGVSTSPLEVQGRRGMYYYWIGPRFDKPRIEGSMPGAPAAPPWAALPPENRCSC